MKKDSLGDRIKNNYENRYRIKLTRRMPVILRLDGKAFHTLTKGFNKPFDKDFINIMTDTAEYLISEIQGAKIAYVQSDEISILLTDFDKIETDAWFDYNLQKITSVSAGMCSAEFTLGAINFDHLNPDYKFLTPANPKPIIFDCRAFNIPKEEVVNYFIWRQQDWFRNSLFMYCQSFFSHKDLHKKNNKDQHEMLHTVGKNWTTDLDNQLKNGTFIFRNTGTYSGVLKYEDSNKIYNVINAHLQGE